MKLLLHIFLIFAFATRQYCCNVHLIKDYLKANYLTTLLWVSCEPTPIETLTALHGIWINVWDIADESALTDFNYDKFFGRYSQPHAAVLNLECNQTNSFMTQASKRILFHNERYWLMFNSNLHQAVDVLSRQNINVDAEIILALSLIGNDAEEVKNYELYEAFNPSSVRGGRINITQLGYWNRTDGFNIPVKQTKIERRRNLRGIILPSVISVTCSRNMNLLVN